MLHLIALCGMASAPPQVYGFCKPYAITGSLPCIKELQVRE